MFTHSFKRDMKAGPDICDITEDLVSILGHSGITTGMIHIFVPGSTGSVTAIEYEAGVVEDLKRAITELAPPDRLYDHERAWRDGNGHSHVQSAIMGPSLSVPVRNSIPALGTWQQIVVINHDNGPRTRKIEITITGC